MTNKQKAREVFAIIRQQEAVYGIDFDVRAKALSAILGWMNAEKDSRFKGMALKAINENRRNLWECERCLIETRLKP